MHFIIFPPFAPAAFLLLSANEMKIFTENKFSHANFSPPHTERRECFFRIPFCSRGNDAIWRVDLNIFANMITFGVGEQQQKFIR